MVHGLSGTNLIVDFVDEVQVKSSGYTAEYGGAMGGVISAITKSGTNAYHGTALINFEGSGLAKDNVLSAGALTNPHDAPHVADRLEQGRVPRPTLVTAASATSRASPSAVRS